MKVAEIVVDAGTKKVEKPFHYLYDDICYSLQPGMRVVVPFGGRNCNGYVIKLDVEPEVPYDKLKKIKEVIDSQSLYTEEMLQLADWMSEYYLTSKVTVLDAMLPSEVRNHLGEKHKRIVTLVDDMHKVEDYKQLMGKRYPKQLQVIELLETGAKKTIPEICKQLNISSSPINTLVNKGILEIGEIISLRNPKVSIDLDFVRPLQLTKEQQVAFQELKKALSLGEFVPKQPFLLHGVTGSGKTEIYLQIIAEALKLGKGAIVLVPEISLTPQTVQRFKSRFNDLVAVLHSRLSAGERRDEWMSIFSGERKVVVGARSAVFAPINDLGLIIIDEEHENTYKQDETPRYHARDVARKRAELVKGMVVLGSATPSVETYYLAKQGEYNLLTMEQRASNKPLPLVEIVDMRQELEAGNKSIFSRSLEEKIQSTVEQGKQVILFLNRRGFSTFVVCRQCGYVMKCRSCDISLTYHIERAKLLCHYCNQEYHNPDFCPKCNSRYIKYFGAGTQKVEEAFKAKFPNVSVIRMDVDTTRNKGDHERILSDFRQGKTQVLIGTQMIAKGHDFPNVTLVGVISSDISLNLPDFRSGERTFQLLTQVAGRAGRGEYEGEVVIQTYNSEHYSVDSAQQHDFLRFYQEEISIRELTDYPPFSKLIRLVVSGTNESQVIKVTNEVACLVKEDICNTEVELLGPAPAPISKVKNRYRWHIALRGKRIDEIKELIKQRVNTHEKISGDNNVRIIIDVDPQAML